MVLLLVRALEQGSRANVLVEIPVRPDHPKSWMIILFSLDKFFKIHIDKNI